MEGIGLRTFGTSARLRAAPALWKRKPVSRALGAFASAAASATVCVCVCVRTMDEKGTEGQGHPARKTKIPFENECVCVCVWTRRTNGNIAKEQRKKKIVEDTGALPHSSPITPTRRAVGARPRRRQCRPCRWH